MYIEKYTEKRCPTCKAKFPDIWTAKIDLELREIIKKYKEELSLWKARDRPAHTSRKLKLVFGNFMYSSTTVGYQK